MDRPAAGSVTALLTGAVFVVALLLGAGPLAAQAESYPPPAPRDDRVRVLDHPDEDQVEVIVGPVSLSAGGPHFRLPVQIATLPIDGWLHGFAWDMKDARGRPLPDELLHHVNFIDPDHRELFAPIPRRVLAAGRETKRQGMPPLLGYPMEAGSRILISAMFANPTDADYEEAYLHVRLSYSDREERLIAPLEVYPFYLDVMGPVGAKEFPVPPGHTVMSWEGRPAIDGRILAIGGHMHDYGAVLRLEDVTEGEVVWETEPERSESGRVVGVPTGKLWWRGGVKIHRDHTYRIVVEYRNPGDRPAPDRGMGALGGVVLAPRDARWPPLDRRNEAYVQDLRNTLEKPFRDEGHEHGGHGEPEGPDHHHAEAGVGGGAGSHAESHDAGGGGL